MKTKTKKAKMTAAEIKEAIKRDKEWMDNIGPDDEIAIPESGINALFDGDEPKDNGANEFGADDGAGETEGDEDGSIDNVEEGAENEVAGDVDDDDDVDTSGVGGVIGAIVGGIGGMVLGGILGTALFDD